MVIKTIDDRILGDFPRGRNGNNAMFEVVTNSSQKTLVVGYKYEEYTSLQSAYESLSQSVKLRQLPIKVIRKYGKLYFVRTDITK